MIYEYDLTLGLPHTNHRFLSEHLLLKYAGHFQWSSIAAAAGRPLSSLRTNTGGEVYASFYYIEERIPETAPLDSFRLDDTIRFLIALRSYKSVAIEGRLVFDRPERLLDRARVDRALDPHSLQSDFPFIRFANIFISPEKGNSRLRVAPPAHTEFRDLPVLPNDENPYHLTREAAEHGSLGLLEDGFQPCASFEHSYAIDVDRDTNGAGLVYFANYLAFMDTAERLALATLPETELDRTAAAQRSLRQRRIAYYGNADVHDTLTIRVQVLRMVSDPRSLAFRYSIDRHTDGQRICLSESIKAIPVPAPD